MAHIARNYNLTKLMRMKMRDGRPGNTAVLVAANKRLGVTSHDSLEEPGNVQQGTTSISEPTRICKIRNLIHEIIHMKKTDSTDSRFSELCEEYWNLDEDKKRRTLFVIATEYGIDRASVRDLARHYLTLQCEDGNSSHEFGADNEKMLSAMFRTEEKMRSALTPLFTRLFERMNWQPGGLKFLVDLRADLRAAIEEQNVACLRALDAQLKEMLANWLSPAGLELHQITWNDPASLLEKIVVYEAVHPVSNLYDLRRRLGVGRRCFGYFHPSIPGEPLIFIQVALTNKIVESIQEVLWDEPPIPESEARIALFYSISSTQPGLSGINLGKFLIKRVVRLLQQENPSIQTFATLSPIPGFMKWLLPKLVAQAKYTSSDLADTYTLKDDLLLPAEEKLVLAENEDALDNINALHRMWVWLTSPTHEWRQSEKIMTILKPILLRLCARYILKEKKRGRALDPVANFHAQNGAVAYRLNWMGDKSMQGLDQSAGIMINYLYRLEEIEENSQAYFDTGIVPASLEVEEYLCSAS